MDGSGHILKEGNTEVVSVHMTGEEHEGDVKYRGQQRRKLVKQGNQRGDFHKSPHMNKYEGRYYLPAIYDNVFRMKNRTPEVFFER